MLYVVYDDGVDKMWNVGQEFFHGLNKEMKNVVEIQADGDELKHILENVKGIPTHNSRKVVTWYGDHAKFIVGNVLE